MPAASSMTDQQRFVVFGNVFEKEHKIHEHKVHGLTFHNRLSRSTWDKVNVILKTDQNCLTFLDICGLESTPARQQ